MSKKVAYALPHRTWHAKHKSFRLVSMRTVRCSGKYAQHLILYTLTTIELKNSKMQSKRHNKIFPAKRTNGASNNPVVSTVDPTATRTSTQAHITYACTHSDSYNGALHAGCVDVAASGKEGRNGAGGEMHRIKSEKKQAQHTQRMNNNIGQFKLKNTLNYRKSNYCALYFSRKISADKYSLDGIITYFPLIKCDSSRIQFSAAFNYYCAHSPLCIS